MRYWCAHCQKEIPPEEVAHIPGAMHILCKSGRVTPIPEEKK